MDLRSVKHLGWVIPFAITQTQGQRWREPGRGVCHECGDRKPRVYVRGDGTIYCSDCIMFDLAEANPSDEMKREQRHPEVPRVGICYELRWDAIASVFTDDGIPAPFREAFA